MYYLNRIKVKEENIKTTARILLGAGLIAAGIGHLTFARKPFRAQVPDWVPLKKDDTVVYSGLVEIALGTALVVTPKKYEDTAGKIAAGLFVGVFPGNISQYTHKRSAFGLNTDGKRFLRLFFQPVLVYWALKSTEKSKIRL
ncbi:membrane protein [Pedobacter jeongneungensis]|uniref:Membrane protein n=1 Tax=Pedobacter jeongneungensis TaxID=947309 RepID=A0ABP8B3N4_9SPHI